MALKLLQIDFPTQGPWGDEMTAVFTDLANTIAETPGLIGKIWTENAATGEAGGIYLFRDQPALEAYLAVHLARLQSFGIEQIRAKQFDVNEPLTRITRGQIAD